MRPEATVPALRVADISKHFGGVRALRRVALQVEQGSIHGLVGQNGSGKSTLIKILSGFHTPDAGELEVYGEPVSLPLHPGKYRELGLAFVHQDLGLIQSLSVLENLRIEEFADSRAWRISWRTERARARKLFEDYGVDLDVKGVVGNLAPLDQALLAIVRASHSLATARQEHGGQGVLVLDEPTVLLPQSARAALFRLVKRIASRGGSVVFVSHYLDEVLEITDRVTVLRNGEVVGTRETSDLAAHDLAAMIVGSTSHAPSRPPDLPTAQSGEVGQPTQIEVRDLVGDGVDEASFDIHGGEILGITGLPGSGFERIPSLLFGASAARQGSLTLRGRKLQLTRLSPARAIAAGIAGIPADRKRDGSIESLPAVDNVMSHTLGRYGNLVRPLDRGAMRRATAEVMDAFDVRPARPSLTYGSFSGGNQQKLLIAKWLQIDPLLVLAHEPTQGVDVGARRDILRTLRAIAENGGSILYASVDHDELAAICDRVLIFEAGRISSELVGSQVSAQEISERCYGEALAEPELLAGAELDERVV
jgi:ribose transport system ATP-binding protein